MPNPDDRHVVAAAIAAGASVILTWNLRDFPTKELKKHGLVRQNPNVFLTDLYDKAPDLILASLGECAAQSQQDAHLGPDFIDTLNDLFGMGTTQTGHLEKP